MAMPGNSSTTNGSAVSAVDATTDMFAGFGLEAESLPNKKPVLASNAKVSSSAPPTNNVLSLEDKQRMAKEQGFQDTFKKQQPLFPSPPPPASTINKPSSSQGSQNFASTSSSASSMQNLTSSLINSNISMMCSQPKPPTMNGHQGITPLGSTNMGMVNNFVPAFGNMGSTTSSVPMNVGVSTMPTSGNMFPNLGGMNSWSNQISSPNMMQMPQQQTMNQMGTSMNSFASMMTPLRPMNMNSSPMNNSNSGVKPLSSSDINDLLS